MAISNFFELLWSLNQYKAHSIQSQQSSTAEYIVEVTYNDADYFHDGDCSLKLYVNKETKDIQINKWSFPYIIKGKYHYPPQFRNTPQSIRMTFECIDPYNKKQTITVRDCEHWEQSDFAELYLNTLFIISSCSNIDEYHAINSLINNSYKAYSISEAIKLMEQLLHIQNFITNYQTRECVSDGFINNINQLIKEKFYQLKQSLNEIKL